MSPWVRLDENAVDHPKFIGLVDVRRPFDLWVWMLSYCQRHLTDGLLVGAALPKQATKAMDTLIARKLVTKVGEDYRLHDYHEWNATKEVVRAKQAGSRERSRKYRATHPPSRVTVLRDERISNTRTNAWEGEREDLSFSSEGVQGEPSPPLDADEQLDRRAADFLEKYPELFAKHRQGARHPLLVGWQPLTEARGLCATWDDARLEKLAVIFLTTDDEFIAKTGRPWSLFVKRASWCDDRLTQWEREQRRPA